MDPTSAPARIAAARIADESPGDCAEPGLPQRDVPCSLGQKRFWVLNQIHPGSPALHVAARWQLEGHITTALLEQGFRLILARHEVLRAAFEERGCELRQNIRPAVDFHIPELDLSGLAEAERETEAARIAELEARASFDLLAAPPFIRATRLRLHHHLSVLLVSAHHIVMDGWSLGILARELGEICEALQHGRLPALPELAVSFCDYCAWQAEAAGWAGMEREEAFWRAQLQGSRQFELAPDRARPPVQSVHSRIAALLLQREQSDGLAALARQQSCTLFMCAAAVLLALLHRYSGETDLSIGTQTPGREEFDLEPLIGPFVNTLVLRTDLSGDPAFAELLERVRATVAEAFEHQRLPLEKVLDIVRPPRDLSRHPLVSINFVLHRPHVRDADHGRFHLAELPPVATAPIYDLSFYMVERAGGWELCCEYDAALYEDATVERLLRGFGVLAAAAVADPRTRLSALPAMEPGERAALLERWNATCADYPRESSATALFACAVQARAAACALVSGERALTYAELDAAANRLARELQRCGLGRGRLVGLFLPRSADLVIALLATLKCGAAYVPIDPSHPQERIAYVVANSGLSLLVSEAALVQRLDAPAVPWLLLDQDAERIAAHGGEPLAETAVAGDRAYVIYTSGSTGRPKGVEIAQRGLVNLLCHARREPGLGQDDVFLALSTIAFDIATLEILLPLTVGATLVLATEEQAADGATLKHLLQRHAVTAMFAAPVTWQLLLMAGWRGSPGLKMLCGGEALPRQLAEALLRGGGELWNLYGPTETTILSSAVRVDSGSGPVPLGPPIANTRFYVLDAQLQPVPPGAPGELYIGGDGVGLGYLGAPALTAERFIPDPFRRAPGARLYRSGDFVRLRPQGRLEYLGRADGQVKLRGLRIELGEIEAVLLAQPALAEALASVDHAAAGGGAIVAYVVPRQPAPEPRALVAALRRQLARFLPRYMCPSAYVVLDALPRLPNGKIDRGALPPAPPPAAESTPAATMSPAEQRIAGIWHGLLPCTELEPASNFFECGGHSLLAAQMLARIEREFGARISLSALFQQPTIQGLAWLLSQDPRRQYDFRQVIKLQPNGARAPLIAINNTGIYGLLAKRLGSERPFTSLQLFDPSLRQQSLPQTLEEIAQAYLQLIRRVQPQGPYALLGWCVAGTLAFEIARQLQAGGERVAQLFMIDTYVPRYFRRLPRWRRRLAQSSQRLQLIRDDWSRTCRDGQSLGAFLARRETVRKLRRWLGRSPAAADAAEPPTPAMGDERYDQWLLHYLQDAAERYEPVPMPGRLVLFRSAEQPRGRFLDCSMGWAGFTAGGVEVVEINGDHFSMFRDPGVGEMACRISALLDGVDPPARGELH